MIRRLLKSAFIAALLTIAIVWQPSQINAGDVILSNNSGGDSTIWFISGEPSLVINGFDLQALGLSRPVSVDRVSIDVETPVAGATIQAVVYEDVDGGSPANATIAGSTTLSINTSGVISAIFNPPIEITAPVIWVGFYLPVDFEFRADTSGSSVLTYWAWTPGTTFDFNNLSSAQVLGPADGSAPVEIDMNGIARITAELITGGQTITTSSTSGQPTVQGELRDLVTDSEGRIIQVVGDANTSLAPMVAYPGIDCSFLYYDNDDIFFNYQTGLQVACKRWPSVLAPETPDGYILMTNYLLDVTIFGIRSSGTERVPYPITHCLELQSTQVDRAVLGLAWGAPREWEILPTVRYGNFICANINYGGYISYFVPQ